MTGSQTLSYTGSLQTFTVKSCVTSITIDAYGAQGGGTSSGNPAGGKGARMSGTFAIAGGTVPGDVRTKWIFPPSGRIRSAC